MSIKRFLQRNKQVYTITNLWPTVLALHAERYLVSINFRCFWGLVGIIGQRCCEVVVLYIWCVYDGVGLNRFKLKHPHVAQLIFFEPRMNIQEYPMYKRIILSITRIRLLSKIRYHFGDIVPCLCGPLFTFKILFKCS